MRRPVSAGNRRSSKAASSASSGDPTQTADDLPARREGRKLSRKMSEMGECNICTNQIVYPIMAKCSHDTEVMVTIY